MSPAIVHFQVFTGMPRRSCGRRAGSMHRCIAVAAATAMLTVAVGAGAGAQTLTQPNPQPKWSPPQAPAKSPSAAPVKSCSAYGAGFVALPGTDTCVKIGGYIRGEVATSPGR